jgi:excisionase family DNA binding protein
MTRNGPPRGQDARKLGDAPPVAEAPASSVAAVDNRSRAGSTSVKPSRSEAAAAHSLGALPPLLTIAEVASVLRTSRKAIYAMADRGQLAGLTRIGRRLLVRRDDLLSWLDERRAASPGGTRR